MMSHATAANIAANRNQPASLNVRREIHGLRLLPSSSVISFRGAGRCLVHLPAYRSLSCRADNRQRHVESARGSKAAEVRMAHAVALQPCSGPRFITTRSEVSFPFASKR